MTSERPKISVIMAVQDQAHDLELNLPIFLTQQGEADYEVIVVNDSSTDETTDVLKRMKAEYPHLYTTFLPSSIVPYPSRLRLALTIGAKDGSPLQRKKYCPGAGYDRDRSVGLL